MTSCADCSSRVDPRHAVIYVRPDGQEAITLCRSCRVNYPSKRQYRPSTPPSRSRYDLRGVGRDPEEGSA